MSTGTWPKKKKKSIFWWTPRRCAAFCIVLRWRDGNNGVDEEMGQARGRAGQRPDKTGQDSAQDRGLQQTRWCLCSCWLSFYLLVISNLYLILGLSWLDIAFVSLGSSTQIPRRRCRGFGIWTCYDASIQRKLQYIDRHRIGHSAVVIACIIFLLRSYRLRMQ